MSDVVVAALVAGGVGVASNIVTLFVARRNADTTERVAREQASVSIENERARHASEMAQLERDHVEADRQVRRDAYARLLMTIEEFDALTSAYTAPASHDAMAVWVGRFREATIHVRLVESAEVGDARRKLNGLLDSLTPVVEASLDAGQPMEDALGYPYVEMRSQFADAGKALGDAMRDDLAYARRS